MVGVKKIAKDAKNCLIMFIVFTPLLKAAAEQLVNIVAGLL